MPDVMTHANFGDHLLKGFGLLGWQEVKFLLFV